MSDRHTPETDDAQWGTGKVTTDFARRLERERDEAREQVENQKARIGEFFAALEKLTSERDEARAVANELADIASHCLGWHDHESVETAEQIANALKRWRNLK